MLDGLWATCWTWPIWSQLRSHCPNLFPIPPMFSSWSSSPWSWSQWSSLACLSFASLHISGKTWYSRSNWNLRAGVRKKLAKKQFPPQWCTRSSFLAHQNQSWPAWSFLGFCRSLSVGGIHHFCLKDFLVDFISFMSLSQCPHLPFVLCACIDLKDLSPFMFFALYKNNIDFVQKNWDFWVLCWEVALAERRISGTGSVMLIQTLFSSCFPLTTKAM